MNFKQLIAKYISGNLGSSQVPEICYVAFEEGYVSEYLWILAGLEKNEDQFIVDKYLQLSLDELKIAMPDKRLAVLQYAHALAEEAINGYHDLIDTVREIIRVLETYDFRYESSKYVYGSVFFEKVYGEYYNYEDLVEAMFDWSKEKSNEILKSEVEKELYNELKIWTEKIGQNLSS